MNFCQLDGVPGQPPSSTADGAAAALRAKSTRLMARPAFPPQVEELQCHNVSYAYNDCIHVCVCVDSSTYLCMCFNFIYFDYDLII